MPQAKRDGMLDHRCPLLERCYDGSTSRVSVIPRNHLYFPRTHEGSDKNLSSRFFQQLSGDARQFVDIVAAIPGVAFFIKDIASRFVGCNEELVRVRKSDGPDARPLPTTAPRRVDAAADTLTAQPVLVKADDHDSLARPSVDGDRC